MYQLASSRASNLAPQVKNDAIGLWYDAKTKVAALLIDFRSQIGQKKSQIEGNLLSSKINSVRNHHQPTLLEQLEATNTGGGHVPEENHSLRGVLEESLRKELSHIKKKQDQHAKAV